MSNRTLVILVLLCILALGLLFVVNTKSAMEKKFEEPENKEAPATPPKEVKKALPAK